MNSQSNLQDKKEEVDGKSTFPTREPGGLVLAWSQPGLQSDPSKERGGGGMVVPIVTMFSFEQLYIYQWIYIDVCQF